MESKIFSYKVTGVVLQPFNDTLKLSQSFDKKELLNEIKEILKAQNFKIDEQSLNYKIVDDQLYIQGLAAEITEPKSIGFMMGK